MTKSILKSQKKKAKWAEILFVFLLILPWLLNTLIFWFGTNVQAFIMMFTSYDTKEFTLQNFTAAWELFTTAKDANLSLALLNTAKFFLVSFFTIPIPIITAYVLYKKVFLNNFIRIVLYLPGAISGIMMARLFNQFVQSQGILGGILEAFGLPMKSASLFTDESTALGTIMFFDVWMGLGGSLILWLGAVNRIPTELVEYNKLLGLGELKEFVLVVLPLIWPTFVTMVTLSLIGFFGATGSVLVFTQGNAGTTTISYWMYRILLNQEESMFHISNAAGLIMMLLTVPVVFVGRFIMNKWGQEIEY
mgnify:FL=1